MSRGVRFISDRFLYRLPQLIGIVNYDWVIDDTEIYNPGLPDGRFCGEKLKEILKADHEYNFVRIRRYPMGSTINDIADYDEYLSSECTFLLLCYDGGFYEIYDKDTMEISRLYDACIEIGCADVLIVTDENDERYSMHF